MVTQYLNVSAGSTLSAISPRLAISISLHDQPYLQDDQPYLQDLLIGKIITCFHGIKKRLS